MCVQQQQQQQHQEREVHVAGQERCLSTQTETAPASALHTAVALHDFTVDARAKSILAWAAPQSLGAFMLKLGQTASADRMQPDVADAKLFCSTIMAALIPWRSKEQTSMLSVKHSACQSCVQQTLPCMYLRCAAPFAASLAPAAPALPSTLPAAPSKHDVGVLPCHQLPPLKERCQVAMVSGDNKG